MDYTAIEVLQSETFKIWFADLRDRQAKARIAARIRRLSLGNAGDTRFLEQGVSELRIDWGPGYRVYFQKAGPALVILLCGGDKRSQSADILRAIEIASDWEDDRGL